MKDNQSERKTLSISRSCFLNVLCGLHAGVLHSPKKYFHDL